MLAYERRADITLCDDGKPWPPATGRTKLQLMGTMNFESGYTPRRETEVERQRRIAWEAERIAEARASAAAGRVVSSEDVDAWIDSLDTDHELPAPRSGR
jgi:hypothetical protein